SRRLRRRARVASGDVVLWAGAPCDAATELTRAFGERRGTLGSARGAARGHASGHKRHCKEEEAAPRDDPRGGACFAWGQQVFDAPLEFRFPFADPEERERALEPAEGDGGDLDEGAGVRDDADAGGLRDGLVHAVLAFIGDARVGPPDERVKPEDALRN